MKLEGLTVNFLGDSITEGTGVSNIAENRYDNRLKKMYNLKATNNYGIGGTRLAHQEKPSEKTRYDLCFCGRAYNMDPSADLIVVYGGVNDYIHGDAYFGKMEDRTPETFCGAVYYLMQLLRELYPETPFVFMTPAHCNFKGTSDKEVSPRPMKKPDADNVVKIILDSLNKVAYPDDVQVVDCQVRRFYSERPRVIVTIQEAAPVTSI